MSGDVASGSPPPKQGLSTGSKFVLGCLGLFVVGGLFAVFALGAGAWLVGKKAKDVVGAVRGDGASGDLLKQLEDRYSFEPPADGVVGDERARRFARAVDATWVRLKPVADALNASAAARENPAGVREAISGVKQGFQGVEDLRQSLADGLQEARMPLKEFLWTSKHLIEGYRALSMRAPPASVPKANMETARAYRVAIANLAGGPDQTENLAGVLSVALGAGAIFGFDEMLRR